MKVFAIIKNNNLAKLLFIIISLLVIFHQVIYHIISVNFFKNNDDNDDNDDNNIKENFLNLDKNKTQKMFLDKDYINKLKEKHEKEIKKYKLNTYPNLDSKRPNLFLNENKFLPQCCVLNYEISSDTGCACMTPEQKYYLQYRANNRNKDKLN